MPLLNIMAALFFIILAWYGLQALKYERLVRQPNGPRAKLLLIIMSIVLGSTVARFFTDYLAWFTMLGNSIP